MNKEESLIYLQSQIVCALAEIEGMKAENMIRESLGHSMAYSCDAFVEVPARYGIERNQVLELLLKEQSK